MMASDDVDAQVSTLTVQAHDSCHIGIGKLPTELLYHIIRLAASTDYKTAHACAYVSKLICKWTAPDRWRTIVCTSGDQLEALWEALEYPIADTPARFTSLPGPQPGAFVENLFIDTDGEKWTFDDLVDEHMGLETCRAYSCPRLDSRNKLVCGPDHIRHHVHDFLRHFPHVNYLALGSIEAIDLRLDTVSPAKLLCSIPDEHALIGFIDQMGPLLSDDPEAPAHVDDALWRADGSRFWKPSLEMFRRRLAAVHFVAVDPSNKLSGVTMPARAIEALRAGSFGLYSFLRRMADNQAGGPPPRLSQQEQQKALASKWYIWPAEDRKGERRYARGSDPLASSSVADLQAENGETCRVGDDVDPNPLDNPYSRISPAFWSEFRQGVTKIRYDTRKFAFRPCEITASRLKPFFEEISTTGLGSAETSGEGPNTSTTAFTHSGPRHAAPHRGAGHFSKPDLGGGGQHHPQSLTAKQAALDTFGCGKFETLHLCWDPVPGTDDAANNGSDAPSLSLASGIVGQTDWPVERQDIWTNTTSQNNEAQAPPPHTADSQNGRSTSSKTSRAPSAEIATARRESWRIPSTLESQPSKNFRADLVDCIRSTVGWTWQDQQLLDENPSVTGRSHLIQRFEGGPERFNRFESLVAEMAHQQSSLAPPPMSSTKAASTLHSVVAPDDENLTLRIVPPASRLKLGGMYVPYTKQQRVQWFLANLETDDA